jgi:hypothetical protein
MLQLAQQGHVSNNKRDQPALTREQGSVPLKRSGAAQRIVQSSILKSTLVLAASVLAYGALS